MTQIPPENEGGEAPPPDPSAVSDEKSRRQRAEQEKQTRDLQLTNAMLRAGIDPDSSDAPMNKLFFEGYKGDITSEAVIEAAKGYGLIKEPETPSGEITDPAERGQTGDRQQVAAGSIPDGNTPTKDPRLVAIENGQAAMDAGGTQESAMGTAFDTIAAAGFGDAASGRAPDERAQWYPGKEDPRRPDLGW